ncbi:Fibroblast growth factor receptor 4 [Orchesella cincta]|uniref:receptor protein-tyrosine kinase n=1 Tax=Orchesella cincta TaxID=48709 RepID=A0A1D2MBV6_ORCCI|nr:Fibroblast growth factor receptor 4 [Orchesella cincta]
MAKRLCPQLPVLLFFLNLGEIVKSAPNQPILDRKYPERNQLPDTLQFVYNTSLTSLFRELEPAALQFIGNDTSRIKISCEVTNNPSTFIDWDVHAVEKQKVKRSWSKLPGVENGKQINLETGPPVISIECWLQNEIKTLSKKTLIYAGADTPPYLYKHGKVARALITQETTAVLPCLLSYPLEHTQQALQLQLFKNGSMVNKRENGITYTPELGYILDLKTLKNPHGNYECRVVNSTIDDFLIVQFDLGAYIRLRYTKGNGQEEPFSVSNKTYPFECQVPRSSFQATFQWFYEWINGTFTFPNLERSEVETSETHYNQTAYFTFPSGEIARVGCVGTSKAGTRYNATYQVYLKRDQSVPTILNGDQSSTLAYKPGMNLTCKTKASSATWKWLKDGKRVTTPTFEYDSSDPSKPSRSVLTLNPSRNDTDVRYTCFVRNDLGEAFHTFRVTMGESKTMPLLLIALGIVAAALIGVLITRGQKKPTLGKRKRDWFKRGTLLEPLLGEEEHETTQYFHVAENTFNHLLSNTGEKLGSGNYGKVVKAYLREGGTKIPVAVKIPQLKPDGSLNENEAIFTDFLAEIKRMQYIHEYLPNNHVLKFIGAVTNDIAHFKAYLIVEYCAGRDMKTFLTKFSVSSDAEFYFAGRNPDPPNNHGPGQVVLRTENLMAWCEQMALGMAHISTLRLVHRDLAARNIFLASPDNSDISPERLVAKIGDFGLARKPKPGADYYVMNLTRDQKMPVRWYAPEVLRSGKFTTKSDVWSLGILFWELFTLGKETPFSQFDMLTQLHGFVSQLENGELLPSRPPHVPPPMWNLMQNCWKINPADRPTFSEIHQQLKILNNPVPIQTQRPAPDYYTQVVSLNEQGHSVLGPASPTTTRLQNQVTHATG